MSSFFPDFLDPLVGHPYGGFDPFGASSFYYLPGEFYILIKALFGQ